MIPTNREFDMYASLYSKKELMHGLASQLKAGYKTTHVMYSRLSYRVGNTNKELIFTKIKVN